VTTLTFLMMALVPGDAAPSRNSETKTFLVSHEGIRAAPSVKSTARGPAMGISPAPVTSTLTGPRKAGSSVDPTPPEKLKRFRPAYSTRAMA
jgi:hypothetical protein